jgi:hypothetical protein
LFRPSGFPFKAPKTSSHRKDDVETFQPESADSVKFFLGNARLESHNNPKGSGCGKTIIKMIVTIRLTPSLQPSI